MIKVMMKASIIKATMLALVAGAVFAGCTGCGSKTASEQEKTEAQVPKDAMQKTYQGSGGRPGQNTQ
jgi:hypothetical protein